MKFIKEIKEDTILVIPNVLKKKILNFIDTLDRLINVKIFTLEEVKEHIHFSYDQETILYLMDKYNYKYEVSKILIENMYFVTDKVYSSNKLNQLVRLKKELLEKDLLKEDKLFFDFINSKKIIVYGYDYIDKFNKNMLDKFDNVAIVKCEKTNDRVFDVCENNTIFDEVNFVFSSIAELLEKGVDINRIKITNIDSDYHHALITLSNFYNIPISLEVLSPIISTKVGKCFLEKLRESTSVNEAIESFSNEVVLDDRNSKIYSSIISICNKYIDFNYSYKSIKEAVQYELKHTSLSKIKLDKAVEIVPFYDNIFVDDEYVFFLGFNQGSTPFIYKDEDYISDNLKKEVLLDFTNEKNYISKIAFINKLKSINNLIITYKLNSISSEFYPSNLIKELKMNVIKPKLNSSYSKEYSEIILGKMLDNLIKYDLKDTLLDNYYSNLSIPYMRYNNKFTGITYSSLLKKINNKLLLSYSSIDNYYRCAFRYYISNVLKIDKYEESFKTFVGNLFHYVLSKSLDEDFSFDNEWNSYIAGKQLLVSEEFFLNKLKEELVLIIETVKKLHKETGLTNYMLEQKIYIDKSRDIPITFMGIVDKIMYKNVDGEDLISVIDYKTGNPNTNLFNVIYGIDMQLPVYLYLIKYGTLFSNASFVGFYLQKILHGEILKSNTKSYIGQKEDNLKLTGYSTSCVSKLSRFDPTYENSLFIKSMKVSNKGFYGYAKIIEETKIDALIELVNKKIDMAIDDILQAKFDINPKRVGQENIGCSFCKYKDLCYMREEDIVNLKEYNDFSFLGGIKNAKMD